ncbi:MAG: hypothetical protein EOP11_03515 [Proteobacteria bacterium]|nr:MAG: hypothetical protein EOP11_03515 [Pseudomonadota bacterium]
MKFLPPATLPVFTLLAAFLPIASFGMSTGENNSRIAVEKLLTSQYGIEDSDLSASLLGQTEDGLITNWAVLGQGAGRRVSGRVVCRKVLFVYNKYDRAYRNQCGVAGLSVR